MSPTIEVSDSLRILIAASFEPGELRHLAAIQDAESPRVVARRSLDEQSIEELAELVVGGGIPALGWWRRHSGKAM